MLISTEALIGVALRFDVAPLAIATAALPLLLLFGVTEPEGLLAGFLLAGSTTIGTTVPLDVAGLFGTALFIVVLLRLRPEHLDLLGPEAYIFTGLVLLVVAGYILGDHSAYGLSKTLRFGTLGVLAFGAPAILLRTEKSLVRFGCWLLAAGLTFSLALIFRDVVLGVPGRYAAFGVGTIALARLTGIAIGTCLAIALWHRRSMPWAIAAAVVCLWTLVATASRGPLIALLLATIMVALCEARLSKQNARLLSAGLVATIAVMPLIYRLIPATTVSRYLLLLSNSSGSSTFVRTSAASQSLAAIEQNPLTGLGTGGFEQLNPTVAYPHNFLLEIGAENGALALALGVAFLAIAVVTAYRAARRCPGAASTLLLFGTTYYIINAMISGDINGNYMMLAFAATATSFGRATPLPKGLPRRDSSGDDLLDCAARRDD